MRPLFYDFWQDKKCWEVETQYMFGPEFLVAPVVRRGQREQSVYLPAGAEWVNWWTKECFGGGQEVRVPSPLDQIPLFQRR